MILFLAYCVLFRLFFYKLEPTTKQPESCHSQLLGTLTFRENSLELSDDERGQGGFEIISGDYRFFLVYAAAWCDRPEYAVLTTLAEPPELDELANLSFDGLDGTLPDDVRKVEIVIDSGLVGLYEASLDARWIPGPSQKVVAAIRQRLDGTVCGLKLYPTYGDGDYRVFVRRQPDSCEIILELVGPDEDEGRPCEQETV